MTFARTRDFTKKRPPVRFTIDEVTYHCYKALDLDQLRRFANMASELARLKAEMDTNEEDTARAAVSAVDSAQLAIDKISSLMKIVMKKVSYAEFVARLQPSDELRESDDFEPIDHKQLLDIVKWLMEIYTERPSQPSSNSSATSPTDDGGTSSTAGASDAEFAPTA